MAFPMGQAVSAGSSSALMLLLLPRNLSGRCTGGGER